MFGLVVAKRVEEGVRHVGLESDELRLADFLQQIDHVLPTVHAAPANLAFRREPFAVVLRDFAGFLEGLRDLLCVAFGIGGPVMDAGGGIDAVISRVLAYAPYADLIWVETGTPDLDFAREYAEALHREFPDKLLAYNCSPSFNWKAALDDSAVAKFQRELAEMGYAFQFITLAGFHALNLSMFDLAYGYARDGMTAYVDLQQAEFSATDRGYTAVKHQREVGTGYFDLVSSALKPNSDTLALVGSTEAEQFH